MVVESVGAKRSEIAYCFYFGADCCGPMITLVSVEDVDVDREKVELPDSNSDLMELNSEHESVISVQGGDV